MKCSLFKFIFPFLISYIIADQGIYLINQLHYLPHRFSLEELAPKKGKGVSLAFIDTVLLNSKTDITYIDLIKKPINKSLSCFSHGQELLDIITGLAPACKITMIRAFKEDGNTNINIFLKALECAINHTNCLLCLSLKLGDELDWQSFHYLNIEKYLKKFSWIVAAAGNDGDPDAYHYIGKKISYPARCIQTDLSVGAYGIRNGTYFMPIFSQYELGRGPHLLAPGYSIACNNYTSNKSCAFPLRYGTSYACMFATAFLVLVLAEFQDNFSKQDILKVLKNTCVKQENLREKSLWGIFDVKVSLLLLHILRALKLKCDVSLYIDQFIHIITNFFLNYSCDNILMNKSLDTFVSMYSDELYNILFLPYKKIILTIIPCSKRFEIYEKFWRIRYSFF